jgi:hypothetical protein
MSHKRPSEPPKGPGPTGQFPRGKIHPDDAGEIKIAIAADRKTHTVIMDFGGQVTWLGLPPEVALKMGTMLIAKAKELLP